MPDRKIRLGIMMKRAFLVCLAAALLAGCSTPTSSTMTYISDVTKLRTDLLSENMLETADKTPEVIELNAARAFNVDGTSACFLEVDYLADVGRGFLEIPAGETLSLTIDGTEVKLVGMGSEKLRKKSKDHTVTERAIYEATPGIIRQLANAKKVHVQVSGDKGTVDRWFAPINFSRFGEFAELISK
jgi:hypothetical protein